MNLIPGVEKEDYTDYILYYINDLSLELKTEIRNRLVLICHGAEQAKSSSKIYSYKETLKEFIKRYNTDNPSWTDRKKGLVGELLVHVVLEIEGRFTTASPFFNMEERSFKKGYDIEKILMVGDAPGDRDAAAKNGVHYYPILVGKEGYSWERLLKEAFPKFMEGSFDEEYQAQLIREFEENLGV